MSQNIRAVPGDSPRHGSTWNVAGSGFASMSDSCTRAKPSMADPSKPIPSAKAPSSSAGAIATDFSVPRTSVNHSRTKRMSRSSSVRRTNSCCLSTGVTLCGLREADLQWQRGLSGAVDAEQEDVPAELGELERQGRRQRHVLGFE